MIEQYFTLLTGQLEELVEQENRIHMPSMILQPMEQELLLLSGIRAKIPDDYPRYALEYKGCRTLHNNTEAKYRDRTVRVGTTTLHIKTKRGIRNIEAVLLSLIGNKISMSASRISADVGNDAGFVGLLDNGVVSASYLIGKVGTAVSFHPPGKEKYGDHPYPDQIEDVRDAFFSATSPLGVQFTSPTFHFTSDLAVLVVDVAKRGLELQAYSS